MEREGEPGGRARARLLLSLLSTSIVAAAARVHASAILPRSPSLLEDEPSNRLSLVRRLKATREGERPSPAGKYHEERVP